MSDDDLVMVCGGQACGQRGAMTTRSVSDPSARFGGTKQRGLGREGAREGLREFQEAQYLAVDWPV